MNSWIKQKLVSGVASLLFKLCGRQMVKGHRKKSNTSIRQNRCHIATTPRLLRVTESVERGESDNMHLDRCSLLESLRVGERTWLLVSEGPISADAHTSCAQRGLLALRRREKRRKRSHHFLEHVSQQPELSILICIKVLNKSLKTTICCFACWLCVVGINNSFSIPACFTVCLKTDQ